MDTHTPVRSIGADGIATEPLQSIALAGTQPRFVRINFTVDF